ncbi:MAG: amidohydrolase [Anaerovorax sp.]
MSANLLLKSNAIFDSVKDEPFKGYVAIKGNKIVGVGSQSKDMESFIDEGTKVMEFGDRLIMPGFHDSHTHLILAGLFKTFVNLGASKDEADAARMVKEYYDENPKNGWLIGFNWYHYRWPKKNFPSKETLDLYFKDQPVFLLNAEAHSAWVNSKALALAGITRDTPNPFGGEIAKDEKGEPTGFLYEAALAPVAALAYDFSPEEEKELLINFMETAKPLGITSVVDVQPYFGRDLGSLSVFKEMEDQGMLNVRIHAASNLFGDLDQAKENSKVYKTGKVRANLLKQFVDGVIPTHTALMLEEYLDAPGNKGVQLNPLDDFEEAIMEAHRRELSVKIHAIGDFAIRFTLDCFEKAIKKYGKNGARHAIEHCEMVDEADFQRFGELGIVPSVQPEHLGLIPSWEEEEYIPVLGEEKAGKTWSFKRLLTEAGVLAIGSDCPVVDNNPFNEIHRGVSRLHDDQLPEGGWNPTQKLTVAEVLRGYTYGSAYGVGREDELGTLAPNQLADVVVIDRNLFTVPHQDIRNANVDLTIMDGNIIFER